MRLLICISADEKFEHQPFLVEKARDVLETRAASR
jgi:hypothetical protein